MSEAIIVAIVFLSLVELWLFVMVVRNIFFSRTQQYCENMADNILQWKTYNENAINRSKVLSATEEKYIDIVNSLQNINSQYGKKYSSICALIDQMKLKITSSKFFKLLKLRRQAKSELKQIKIIKNKFDSIANQFNIPWLIVDEQTSNYLEISAELEKVLEEKRLYIDNTASRLEKSIDTFRTNLSNSRVYLQQAKFNQAMELLKESKGILLELTKKVFILDQLEFVIYTNLPIVNQNVKNFYIKKNWETDAFDNIEKDITTLSNNCICDNVDSTIAQIKALYNQIYSLYNQRIIKATALKTVNSILLEKQTLDNLILKSKLITTKNSHTQLKINECIENLERIKNDLLNAKMHSAQTIKELIESFIHNYQNIIYLDIYDKNTDHLVKKNAHSINTRFHNAQSVFYYVFGSNLIPFNNENNQLLDQVEKQFMELDLKNSAHPNFEKQLEAFNQNLASLVKIIAANEQYAKMYKKLETYATTELSEKLNEQLKTTLHLCKTDIINNDYQQAFNKLKTLVLNKG
ncbi:hypothetical protein ACJA23_01640 [Mycoplasma corogypsi]|uniref:hypothetical protein n=1 Tax=Mycoplasma corogypsi TaxID=2106 RepID=UPI003872D81D